MGCVSSTPIPDTEAYRQFMEKYGVNDALNKAVKDAIEAKGENPLVDLMKSLQGTFDAKRFGAGTDLKGTFVVIGCSKGVGLELVKLAKAAGLEVYGTCRKASDALNAVGIKKVIEGIELTDEGCGEKVKAALGGISVDTLVFNAAVGDADAGKENSMIGKGMSTQSLDAVSMENMRKMMEVNAFGLVKIAKALVPLITKNGGRLCTVGTVAASFVWTLDSPFSSGGFAQFFAYRASKVAGMMITQTLAGPLKKDGIAVSVIHPGVGATDLTTAGLTPDGKPIIPDGMEGMMKWPDELAKGVMLAIKNTTLKTTGSFLDGQYGAACVTQPW
jgi:NAD(P)-dependent dehydrogenase (short-subunit alcohol dehydrogenase family)